MWAGPRAVLLGHDPYDPSTWVATASALGTQAPDTSVYIYPPWVVAVLLPLGALPLVAASLVWLALGLGAAIVATRAALRRLLPDRPRDHAIAALALLVSWVGVLTLIIGQWGYFLVAALFTAAVALRDRRPVVAGIASLALLAKPQLFLFTAPAIAVHALWPREGTRPPRDGVLAIAIALAGTIVLVAAGWILLPSWWPTWIQVIGAQQTRPFSDTVAGLVVALFGPGALPMAPVAIAALALSALTFHPAGDAWLPVWTALSIVGAPYTNSYDQIVLLVPVVLAAGALHRRDVRASRRVLWAGALILLLATPLLYWAALVRHSETFGALVSLSIFAIVTGSLWRYRRDPARLAA